MRTSGASTDPIYYIPAIVAVVAVIMLFGGPSNALLWLEHALRSVFQALSSLVASFGS